MSQIPYRALTPHVKMQIAKYELILNLHGRVLTYRNESNNKNYSEHGEYFTRSGDFPIKTHRVRLLPPKPRTRAREQTHPRAKPERRRRSREGRQNPKDTNEHPPENKPTKEEKKKERVNFGCRRSRFQSNWAEVDKYLPIRKPYPGKLD